MGMCWGWGCSLFGEVLINLHKQFIRFHLILCETKNQQVDNTWSGLEPVKDQGIA